MKKINLRELYPDVYTTDFFVDVTEEVSSCAYSIDAIQLLNLQGKWSHIFLETRFNFSKMFL